MSDEQCSYVGRVTVSIYCKETKKEISRTFQTDYYNNNPEILDKDLIRKVGKKALSEKKEVKL